VATVKSQAVIAGVKQRHDTVALVKGQQHRIMQPLFSHMTHLELVYNQLYEMYLIPVELQSLRDLPDLAVDAGIEEPFPPQLLKKLLIMALSALDQGCKDVNPMLVIPLCHQVKYLFISVSDHLLP